MEFCAWPKITRFSKPWQITEKIDGTNAQIAITRETFGTLAGYDPHGYAVVLDNDDIGEDGLPNYEFHLYAGSRNRWLTPDKDNFGFANWVWWNATDLVRLGVGRHYGEWYGKGIQRGYGLDEKRFALFDTTKLCSEPECCPPVKGVETVRVIRYASGSDLSDAVDWCRQEMGASGSFQVPGFMNPEGVVLRHTVSGAKFKVLLENDDVPKGAVNAA
jgi:hypothetical protein